MNKTLALIAFIILLSCNNQSDKQGESQEKKKIETKPLTLKDSLRIYTAIRNNLKIQEAQKFLDSFKKANPEKYNNIKILINEKPIEIFKQQMYEGIVEGTDSE